MKSTYLYVRTRLSLSNEWDDSINWFVKFFPEDHIKSFLEIQGRKCVAVKSLDFLNFNSRTWTNGFVIRFDPLIPLPEFACHARPALEKFDAWCIANDQGQYSEAPMDATFGLFLSRFRERRRAQILVRNEDVDATDRLLVRLRDDLGAYSAPVLHFENGRVIFLDCAQPAGIIERRYNSMFRTIGDYIIIDGSGYCSQPDACAGITLGDLAKALSPLSAVESGRGAPTDPRRPPIAGRPRVRGERFRRAPLEGSPPSARGTRLEPRRLPDEARR